MTKKDKVTVDEVIGLIHTDKPTDSVDEVRKLRGRTNERFIIDDTGTLIDMETRNTYDYVSDVVDLLNDFSNEIKIARTVIQMKRQQISQLKHWNKCLAEKRHQELPYHNYADKEIKDFLKHNIFNCNDR